jgi:hypothetical protein
MQQALETTLEAIDEQAHGGNHEKPEDGQPTLRQHLT